MLSATEISLRSSAFAANKLQGLTLFFQCKGQTLTLDPEIGSDSARVIVNNKEENSQTAGESKSDERWSVVSCESQKFLEISGLTTENRILLR